MKSNKKNTKKQKKQITRNREVEKTPYTIIKTRLLAKDWALRISLINFKSNGKIRTKLRKKRTKHKTWAWFSWIKTSSCKHKKYKRLATLRHHLMLWINQRFKIIQSKMTKSLRAYRKHIAKMLSWWNSEKLIWRKLALKTWEKTSRLQTLTSSNF